MRDWNLMRVIRRGAVVLGASLLLPAGVAVTTTGCGAGPLKSVNEAAADFLLPPSQEAALGEQMEAEIAAQMTELNDPEVQAYVDRVGRDLIAASPVAVPEGIDIEFTVIDDDSTINAFAIPGGHIYVYTGLLKAADNEAELASVLAHEIGHVTERHVAERLVASYGLQTLANIALGGNPGMIGQLVAQVAGTGVLLKHSRDAERESDLVGIQTVVNAGYDPNGYVTFFGKLAQLSDAGASPDFLQTHPDPEERVANARAFIATLDNPPTRTNEAAFQRVSNQL